jgi:single-stranded DNA-binding protein
MTRAINKVTLLGRLGGDPDVRSFEDDGDRVASFSLATNERWRDAKTGETKNRTEWHKISVKGPLVAIVEQSLAKGSRIYLYPAPGPTSTKRRSRRPDAHLLCERTKASIGSFSKIGGPGGRALELE